MRIHTDSLVHQDINDAARIAGVEITRIESHGSRSRHHAFDVYLSGSSPYAQQGDTGYKAATWDEWGIFLAALFDREPTAKAGPYDGRHDFLDKTTEWADTRRRIGQVAVATWLD